MNVARACAFPILLLASLQIVFPMRMPSRPAQRSGAAPPPDTTPLSKAQIGWGTLIFVLTFFALSVPIALVQRWLFDQAAPRDVLLFQHRLTDVAAYPFLPGLFLGIVVSGPILYRLLVWYAGDRVVNLLDRPDRRGRPAALRDELRTLRAWAWPIGILTTLLNLAAFDTFLEVGSREFIYSSFLSSVTHRHPTAEVDELVVYSQRKTPFGNIARNRNLAIRLKDGQAIDTMYLIDAADIPRVLAAFRRSEGFPGKVRAVDGYW